jgi:hypothetical protein
MLTPILIGIVLTGLTVAIHAVGSTYWLRFLTRRLPGSDQPWPPRTALAALMTTAISLLMLHAVEVFLWALTYLALPGSNLETLEQAVYFSLVTFTTLGYGDVTLNLRWRTLSGIEAMNGILLFGWTTALLFSVVQKVASDVRRPHEPS